MDKRILTLKNLPFDTDYLEPYFSSETLKYHHGRHQKAYVDKLNKLIKLQNDPFFEQKLTIEDIILYSNKKHKDINNQAAQIWNHEFLWECLTSVNNENNAPILIEDYLKDTEIKDIENLKKLALDRVLSHFGSGWLWLYFDCNRKLKLESFNNEENPIMVEGKAIWSIDLWEHAYYIDFRNNKEAYFEATWQITNWIFLKKNFDLYLKI